MSEEKYLPSTLTNDENVSVKDKQVEEMAMVICSNCVVSKRCRFYKKPCSAIKAECEALYNAGYRKQSEDTVEIVRCKDCKHRYSPLRCALWYGMCNDKEYFVEHGEDFYCSFGERIE